MKGIHSTKKVFKTSFQRNSFMLVRKNGVSTNVNPR